LFTTLSFLPLSVIEVLLSVSDTGLGLLLLLLHAAKSIIANTDNIKICLAIGLYDYSTLYKWQSVLCGLKANASLSNQILKYLFKPFYDSFLGKIY
jgi:hypothetical protein